MEHGYPCQSFTGYRPQTWMNDSMYAWAGSNYAGNNAPTSLFQQESHGIYRQAYPMEAHEFGNDRSGSSTLPEAPPSSTPSSAAPKRSRRNKALDPVKLAGTLADGAHCSVRKHLSLGCAIVQFESAAMREAVLKYLSSQDEGAEESASCRVGSRIVTVKAQLDKVTGTDDSTSIFIAWDRQNEKDAPLSPPVIAEAFDVIGAHALQCHQGAAPPLGEEVPSCRFAAPRGDAVGN
eukprot:TRINITY_DN74801_c0_g1_i1.p1 TRINITY_DN74801_c0_g1~~TRINITY_DN74801_c0_g1_i1.p1  ORF type:complete len:235 (+),score=36.25 TRINITY_DN74801_c0_g1_i1:82-786(+)